MISIQSAMLVALGFLAASLAALLIAPAFWSRAVRLTTSRIKDSLPLTDIEIRADKDRIRAEYAIKVHKLESLVEQVRLAAARQQIELNRRDATINELETSLERLRSTHEETQNARRVLEQTVADRLPKVEERLTDAKKVLFTRDREIEELTRTADKNRRALAEAASINAQQQAEIERLGTSLSTRAARNQEGTSDPRFDGEVALRAEIEALRAKTREQAQLLVRMQSLAGHNSMRSGVPPVAADKAADTPAGEAGTKSGEVPREQMLAAVERQGELERELRGQRARNDDQAAEITRLKAALAVFEGEVDPDGRGALKESRIALKARSQSLEAQNQQHAEVIQKLRAELASANERLARQASHFTAELKRLGAGTLPASGQARRPAEPARLNLAQRVAQARVTGATQPSSKAQGASLAKPSPQVPDADDQDAPGATPAEAAHIATSEAPEVPEVAAGGDNGRRMRLLDRIANLPRSN